MPAGSPCRVVLKCSIVDRPGFAALSIHAEAGWEGSYADPHKAP